MGNAASSPGSGHPWLTPEWNPNNAGFRAVRATSLDDAHPEGYLRPALRLGDSFSFKQTEVPEDDKPKITGMRFHTDVRAVERAALPSLKSQANARNARRAKRGPLAVAQWRTNMHQARRRALLRVSVLVRLFLLSRGRYNEPLEQLGFYIPLVLREQQGVFIQAHRQYKQLLAVQQYIQNVQERGSGNALPSISSRPLSPENSSAFSGVQKDTSPRKLTNQESFSFNPVPPQQNSSSQLPKRLSQLAGTGSGGSPTKAFKLGEDMEGFDRLSGGFRSNDRYSGGSKQLSPTQFKSASNDPGSRTARALSSPALPTISWSALLEALHSGTGPEDALNIDLSGERNSAPAAFPRTVNDSALMPRLPGAASKAAPGKGSPISKATSTGLTATGARVSGLSASGTEPQGLTTRLSALRDRMSGGVATPGQAYAAAAEERARTDLSLLSLTRGDTSSPDAKGKAADGFSFPSPTNQTKLAGQLSGTLSSRGSTILPGEADLARKPSRSLPSLGSSQPPMQPLNMQWATQQVDRLSQLTAGQQRSGLAGMLSDVEKQKTMVQDALQSCLTRANACSLDRCGWTAPHVDPTPACPAWHDMPQRPIWMHEACKALRQGEMALQIFADQDMVLLPNGRVVDLWSSDPWTLLALEGVEQPDARGVYMDGWCWGTRVLSQVLLSLEACTGDTEVASRTPVILHIHDGQREQVEADMLECSVYSRLANRLLVVQHPRQHAFAYDEEQARWMPDGDTLPEPVGDGLSMVQLGWPGEALGMATATGPLEPRKESALQLLESWGAKWIISWHANDAHFMSSQPSAKPPPVYNIQPLAGPDPETDPSKVKQPNPISTSAATESLSGHMIDPSYLGYCMWLNQSHGATCMIQAGSTRYSPASQRQSGGGAGKEMSGAATTSTLDRVLLQPQKLNKAAQGQSVFSQLAAADSGSEAQQDEDGHLEKLLNIKIRAAAKVRKVREVTRWRLGGNSMHHVLTSAQRAGGGCLPVAAQRYMFHLPTLTKLLSSPLSMRPALAISAGEVRLHLELGDLTHHWAVTPVALQVVGGMQVNLTSTKDLQGWSSLLTQQDALLHCYEGRPMLNLMQPRNLVPKAVSQVPHHIVVLLADNAVASSAVAAAAMLTRPGIDHVHLVTVVNTHDARSDAVVLVNHHADVLAKVGIKAKVHVESREQEVLSDVLANALRRCHASLLVVGSQGLVAGSTGQHEHNMVNDSFALYVMKYFSLPTVVVTNKCKLSLPKCVTPRAPLRTLILVEGHSRPLLHYMCGLLGEGGDKPSAHKLYLAQVYNPKTLPVAMCSSLRLQADKFLHMCAGHLFTNAQSCRLDPPCDSALSGSIKQYALQLMAIQLPSENDHETYQGARFMPPSTLAVLRSSTVPVLVYPRRHADIHHVANPQNAAALLRSSRVFISNDDSD